MTRIEHLLRTRIGLDAASIGRVGIERAVWSRMRSLGLRKLEDYEAQLQRSVTEWNELVEAVVVTESWFFRDAEPIAAFARLVVEEWLPAHSTAPLRLLSIPCASGEEPYSLVMALLDAGVAPERFQVEGVDISARALARAERGVYGKNAFRGKNLAFREPLFPGLQRRICFGASRSQVCAFLPGQPVQRSLPARRTPAYDFIFCRNLLIYFDRPTQRRALARLERLLAPTGMLFVGPVEQAIVAGSWVCAAPICPSPSPAAKRATLARRQRLARVSKRTVKPAGGRGSPHDRSPAIGT